MKTYLYQPSLDLRKDLEATGQPLTSTLHDAFTRTLELTPAAYLWDCRLEIAARLLAQTEKELGVEKVGELVGFSSRQAFIAAFANAWGMSPDEYRQAIRRNPDHFTSTGYDMMSSELLSRLSHGELTETEATEVSDHLWTLLLDACGNLEGERLRAMEERLAEELWEERLRHPEEHREEEPLRLNRYRLFFKTSAFEDLLRTKG